MEWYQWIVLILGVAAVVISLGYLIPLLWRGVVAYDHHREYRLNESAQRTLAFDQVSIQQMQIQKEITLAEIAAANERLRIQTDFYTLRAGSRVSRYVGGRVIEAPLDREQIPGALATNYTYRPEISNQSTAPLAPAQVTAAQNTLLSQHLDLANFTHLMSPQTGNLFLGLDQNTGEPIFETAARLYHSMLNGASGFGKGVTLRLLAPQMILSGADCVFLDKHACAVDPETGEDFRPIHNRLLIPPLTTIEEMTTFITHLVTKEYPKRLEMRRDGVKIPSRLFVVLDEYPLIVSANPEIAGMIAQILRETRKIGIFLMIATQGGLAKQTGLNSAEKGGFSSVIYAGGDPYGGADCLDMSRHDINQIEGTLGKGNVLLKTLSTPVPIQARIPEATNEYLYKLLGRPEISVEDYLANALLEATDVPTSGLVAPIDQPALRLVNVAARKESKEAAAFRLWEEGNQTVRDLGKALAREGYSGTSNEPISQLITKLRLTKGSAALVD